MGILFFSHDGASTAFHKFFKNAMNVVETPSSGMGVLPSLMVRSFKSSGPFPWRQAIDSATSRELPTMQPRGESIDVNRATVWTPRPLPAAT